MASVLDNDGIEEAVNEGLHSGTAYSTYGETFVGVNGELEIVSCFTIFHLGDVLWCRAQCLYLGISSINSSCHER